METSKGDNPLLEWVLAHATAARGRIYYRINGDIPVREGNREVFFEIPEKGRRILILHPCHLTPVAVICYEQGFTMIQVL